MFTSTAKCDTDTSTPFVLRHAPHMLKYLVRHFINRLLDRLPHHLLRRTFRPRTRHARGIHFIFIALRKPAMLSNNFVQQLPWRWLGLRDV